jgi:hypothetical protein
MKQLIGGVAGALITGIAILGWNGHAASDETAWTDARAHGPVQLVSDRVATPAVTEDEAAPALRVTCEPGQRAVVRRAPATAGATMDAGCVGGDDVATLPAYGSFAPLESSGGVRAVPVSYPAPRVTRAAAPRYETYTPSRRVEEKRSWKKRALVIGGSAGAGAGVGALAGGKKGALIGAAIGGGAGTLYEVLKH